MTWLITNIANTDTFQKWLDTTNYLVNAVSTAAVTVGNAAVGSAGVTATFTANAITTNNVTINANLSVNAISIGNSSINTIANSSILLISNTTANISLTIPTAAQISNGQYYHNANGAWGAFVAPYNPATNNSVTTTGTSAQVIDSYLISTYHAAEYLVNVIDNQTSYNRYTSKIIVSTDGGSNNFITEYAEFGNNALGVFTVSSNASSIILNYTPASVSTTVRYVRTII
jgi:hypothetical protein